MSLYDRVMLSEAWPPEPKKPEGPRNLAGIMRDYERGRRVKAQGGYTPSRGFSTPGIPDNPSWSQKVDPRSVTGEKRKAAQDERRAAQQRQRRGAPEKEAPGTPEQRERLAKRAGDRRLGRWQADNPEATRSRERSHQANLAWGGPAKYNDPFGDIRRQMRDPSSELALRYMKKPQ